MESIVPQINEVLTTTPGPFGPFWPCLKKKIVVKNAYI